MARPPEKRPDRRLRRLVGVRGAVARLGGARLCFGKPIRAGEVTVVPVASVHGAGGFGMGTGADDSDGAGGGGWLEARPMGFIEIGPGGARFEPIRDREAVLRNARSAATTVLGVAVAVARIRAVGRRRELRGPRPGVRRLLGR